MKITILLLLVSINYAFSQGNGKIENGNYVCNRFEWKINIPKNYNLTKVQELQTLEKKGNKFHLSDNNFQLQFSVKILRYDRSEAFCGSSGKILHLTFHQLAFSGEPSKPSDYKYKTKLSIKQLCHSK